MSNKYEITGQVKVIENTQTFASGFQKREFVVTIPDGKYPQDIKLELIKDNVTVLDGIQLGDEITVHFNVRGNEYNGKYYVNLVAWRIEQKEQQPPRQEQAQAQQPDQPTRQSQPEIVTDDDGDVPF